MGRNKQSIVPRWKPGVPSKEYSPSWFSQQLRDLGRTLSDWAGLLDDGPIPGGRTVWQIGPVDIDNSGGGAPLVNDYRTVAESAYEPVFASANGVVTGSAVTVDIYSNVLGGAVLLLNTALSIAVGTNRDIRDSRSDFVAGVDLYRSWVVRFSVTVPAGATVEKLIVRLVGSRLGRIPDAGITGTLGR